MALTQLVPVVAGATAYALRTRTLRRRAAAEPHRGAGVPSAARQAAFWTGIAVLAVALSSPIDRIGERHLFWVHMVQHLLLGDVAPLLIVIGLTGAILRPLLRAPVIGRMRVLAFPAAALVLWAVNLYAWHLPGPYQAALRNDWLHASEHVLFFVTGALMWAAVVETLPGPVWFGSGWKAGYTLAVRLLGAILASAFIWSDRVFYPYYAAGERSWGVGALADQRAGGLIMFTEGGTVTLLVFAFLFLRWLRELELRQRLLDEGHDPRAAERAARYGRSRLARH